MDQPELLKMAGLAAKWKEPPRDALDTLVLTTVDLPSLDAYEQIDFLPFDPTIKRTEGTLKGPDGKVFKTTKGAPHIIVKLCDKDPEVAAKVHAKVHELGLRGIRSLAVARTNEAGDWIMLGILTFLDPPRPDTKDTLEKSMAFGVDVKMITGDHTVIAKETCRQLGLGTEIYNAKGLPTLGADGKVPDDLGAKYAKMILEADGFAEVGGGTVCACCACCACCTAGVTEGCFCT
jgi:H+-transporting ATPase